MDLLFQKRLVDKNVLVEIWRYFGAILALISTELTPKQKVVETWDQVHLVQLEI